MTEAALPRPAPTGKLFLGWWLIGYLLFTQVLTVGFLFYGFGVLMDPLAASFGLTRGEASYGFSLLTFGVAAWSPLLGWWAEKQGARGIHLAGLLVLASGLLALGQAVSRPAYYAIMGLWLSFGITAAAGVPSQALVVNWFRRKRGMALSLTSAGVSLGGLVLAPAVGWLIPQYGWVKATLLPATLLVLCFPVGWRLVRNRPEELGLFRDGEREDVPDAAASQTHLGLREILTDRRFLLVGISYSLALSCMTSIMVNVVGYWTDLGLTTGMATLAFALLAGVGMIGKPLFGWLADRYNARYGGMASFLFLLTGTLFLFWPSSWNTVPFVLLFGLGIGGAVPMQSAINGALYGREQFARIAGILTPVIVGVQASFYALTGFLHDRWHSYRPIFLLFAGLFVVALILLSWLRIDSPATERPEMTI